jgi:hypothetical protein
MPRRKPVVKEERPPYVDEHGVLSFELKFKHQPKQLELLKNVTRDKIPYTVTVAGQMLSVGGIRSGKTIGAIMYGVQHYCMKWKKCDMLVLRRTFKELEQGAISDFKAFMPEELYTYDQTKHVATLLNGSRVVFGHCENGKDRDIEQYLGQAYPFIVVDECGQFCPEAWLLLLSRNTANAGCEENEYGHMPLSCIWGCSNPIGPHYEFYRTLFVQKEPWNKPENAYHDKSNGTWWEPQAGDWHILYNPKDYAYQRSTVLDNPAMLKRDPGILQRLNSMPKAKRDKFLFGLDGKFEGQYFDVWDENYHTINLRSDPDAIIWQYYQPVWIGSDWGMSHANTVYFFTKAMVKKAVGNDYVMKTVCFQEIVVTGGKTYRELAALIATKARYPNGKECKVQHFFFSHEKFARQMDTHAPVVEYSKELRKYGLPAATRATQDRIGSASMMYNLLKNGELVILDQCRDIILAVPNLMRNPDLLDDVLKTDTRGDDAYDGFRYGLYGMLSTKGKPAEDTINEHARTLDPLAAFFYRQKQLADLVGQNEPFLQPDMPMWQCKLGYEKNS